MTEPLVIVGAGGMGRCVLDILDDLDRADTETGRTPRWEVVGLVDDGEPDLDLLAARGARFLGPVLKLTAMPLEVGFVLAIGSPRVKRALDAELAATGRHSPALVHPNVHLGFDVTLGPGSIVASHVSMENHIRLGRHVHVNQNSTIGHDTRLGDHVTISPLAAVSGAVWVGSTSFVGTGASIVQRLKLGEGCTVGSGAAVVDHVPAGATVVGVPARPI